MPIGSGGCNCLNADLTSEISLVKLEREARTRIENEMATDHAWFDQTLPALLSIDSTAAIRLHVDVLHLFVQWYFKEGRLEKALLTSEKAVELGRALGQPALLRRGLNLLGATYSRVGNFPLATLCHVEALQIAETIGDRFGKAAVIANLAEARFNAGLIAESILLNRHVLESLGDEPHYCQLAAGAHHNIAVASLLLDDIEAALSEISKAIQLCVPHKNQFWAHQNVVFETTYSKALIRIGEVNSARERAERAQALALRLNSVPARTLASLAMILCEAAEGSASSALVQLERIRPSVDPASPTYRDFLEIEQQCNILAGRLESADHAHERHLLHLSKYQRSLAIKQVAAFQRCIRIRRAATEEELQLLPRGAKTRLLNSSLAPNKLERVRDQLEAIATLSDQREDGTAEHSIRVRRLVELFYAGTGQAAKYADAMGFAARLHDIGKLATPDVLLMKRSKLTPTEVVVIRRHTTEGCQMLTDILGYIERDRSLASAEDVQTLRKAAEIAQNHHEWWDGTGYPRRVAIGAISEAAQVCALADVFDELTMTRPYRASTCVDEALLRISKLSGKQFNPELCAAYTAVIEESQSRYGNELQGLTSVDKDLSQYQIANRIIDRIVESTKGTGRMLSEGCGVGYVV